MRILESEASLKVRKTRWRERRKREYHLKRGPKKIGIGGEFDEKHQAVHIRMPGLLQNALYWAIFRSQPLLQEYEPFQVSLVPLLHLGLVKDIIKTSNL